MVEYNLYGAMLAFMSLNILVFFIGYLLKNVLDLKASDVQQRVEHDQINLLKKRLANGEFRKSEYDDLRLYVLNDQFAHGEIDRPVYEDLHHSLVH